MKTRWLGLDPGLALIGWAVLEGGTGPAPELLDYGVIQTDKALSTPARLLEIEQDISHLLAEFQPDNIVIEMPFFNRQIKAAGGVLQALGVVNLVIYRDLRKIPIFLHQASWKCYLGDGKADKQQVAAMLQQFFVLDVAAIDDSVDAIGIALAGLQGLRNEIT